MKNILLFVLIALLNLPISPQHLPLKIGNQWHYGPGLGFFYAVTIATDTVRINDIKYFRIDYNSGSPFIGYYYDRMEGDSLYYRLYPNGDSLLFNFNWTNGQIISTPESDSCIALKLIYRNVSSYLGVSADIYQSFEGSYCPGLNDTDWTISSQDYSSFFGGICTYDGGTLRGALIDGVVYGTLYAIPVELISFSSSIDDGNVVLNWQTATETNNQGFQIERRKPQNETSDEWNTLGIAKGAGTTTEPQPYYFIDKNLEAGKYQYRLKQIDFDGTFKYSNTIEVEINSPNKFSLEQNYPNPFNPITKIEFTIPTSPLNPSPYQGEGNRERFVTLKVYDVLGNLVATLVDEYKPAGKYEVEFDAVGTRHASSATKMFSSGVYFYRLKVGDFIQSKKMILIR